MATNDLLSEARDCIDSALSEFPHEDKDRAADSLLRAMFAASSLDAHSLRRRLQDTRYVLLHGDPKRAEAMLKVLLSDMTKVINSPLEGIRNL